MNLRLLSLLLAGAILPADSLSDLKGTLARLNGQEPIKASVEYQFWNRQGEEKKPVITEGRATTLVEDGPQGLKMSWSRGLIKTASEEARAKALDPEKKTPTRRAIEGLKAIDVNDYLNGAEELLRTLDQSQLVEERVEAWQGKPARLLQFKVTPRLGQQEKKYIKEMEATAKVWVGSDGLPLAAENQVRMKGRALLVISFEQQQKEEFQFLRAGNRLVVVHHVQENSGSGGGEKGQSRSVVKLSLNGN
jgi:soluble cytochrome b562